MSQANRQEWQNASRIVVKIGSSLLTDRQTGKLKSEWLESLAEDVAGLKKDGKEVVIVSSGAIALGRHVLGLPPGPLKLEESQASAAAGQIHLAHAYEEIFRKHDIATAQILVTLGDTEERRRYLNARGTVATLLRLGALPVVNENDTVATSEIRFGDNDRLAARVATMISADCLVLLSDVDGFYSAPPARFHDAKRFDVIEEITPEIEAMAGDAGTELSRGGMVTKVEAAKIAVRGGTHLVITSGLEKHPLKALGEGANSTWFLASSNPVTARKIWISGSIEPSGIVIIDEGAERALKEGKSLLPAGIVSVEGDFDRGDAVCILSKKGVELGRGLAAYGRKDTDRLKGHKSDEIEKLLGYRGRAEMIHRDDMVVKRS